MALQIVSGMTSASQSNREVRSESLQQLLVTNGLTVGFPSGTNIVLAANHVDLSLPPRSSLGLVGESGCGKSVTLRAILGIVPRPGEVLDGEVLWQGRDLLSLDEKQMREVRGREISMIFQDPTSSLNPVHTVGSQLAELVRIKMGVPRKEAHERAIELLNEVGIPSPAERSRDYPHQLSGGMRQRVMIALAVACGPRVLLADEPTTALDVTIQDQILSLLVGLQEDSGMAMILVSHDLGVISETCNEIAVMYAGYIVERGTRADVVESPLHPYTRALLTANLAFDPEGRTSRLKTIGGQPPDLRDLPSGCPFQARCPHVRPECAEVPMTIDRPAGEHGSACPFVAG
jgi:oligopeptide/dipeptide ABC transporter ATP-binding protein